MPPPRIRIPRSSVLAPALNRNGVPHMHCRYASVATVPAAAIEGGLVAGSAPIQRRPPTQPYSYKMPDLRKTQLHRQYQSLITSTPLMLVFQHNNIKAHELNGLRRELAAALRKVDESEPSGAPVSPYIKLQVIQTGIFASALQVVEFFDPANLPKSSHRIVTNTHGLSKVAYRVARQAQKENRSSPLAPMLKGPMVLLTFPTMSPAHLKAAMSIICPSEKFPAPKRRANPSYHEPAVQSAVQKLMLLAARAEGRTLDVEGARWVGSIEGGLTGLQAQLVALLQQFGVGLTQTLESASKSLYFSLESRREMLEEEDKSQVKTEESSA